MLQQSARHEQVSNSALAPSRDTPRTSSTKVPKRRSSALRFFTSNSSPKHDTQAPPQKEWEAEYLKSLRANRPSRPSGSRPLPACTTATVEPYARATSALALRPSLPQQGDEYHNVPERPISALSHRRAQSDMQKMSYGSSNSGRPLARSPDLRRSTRDFSGSSGSPKTSGETAPVAYSENGMRWMEKQEARALREAMHEMDLREEAKLHTGAQDEATDLVWRHIKEGPPEPDKTRRNYREHLQEGSHARSQSQAWNDMLGERSALDKAHAHKDSVAKISGRATGHFGDHRMPVPYGSGDDGATDCSKSKTHIKWDSPEKKTYTGLAFQGSGTNGGRRRSSATKKRTSSGGPFRNPGDKIYEDSDSPGRHTELSESKASRIPVPLMSKPTDSVINPQPTSSPFVPSTKIPTDRTNRTYRSEIQRNPPSQSRDPAYMQNSRPSFQDDTGADTTKEHFDGAAASGSVEVRGGDIRAATSRRLKDRSPKLPTPSFISGKPGRHIVSFDKEWKPQVDCNVDSDTTGVCVTTNGSKPLKPSLPASVASAPAVPTINISQSPSITLEPHKEDIPSISVSEEITPAFGSHTERSGSVLSPRNKTPANRPLPHHSSTTPVGSAGIHWSLASRRATAQCATCALPISGRIVSAASERFHPDCFKCYHCAEPLECVAFYPEPDARRVERIARFHSRMQGEEVPEGQPRESAADDGDESLRFYCHLDYHEQFSPRCRSCKTPIESEVVVACGGTWHVGHFFCAECGDPFNQKTPFVEKDGYAWCVRCHAGRFSGKCKGCRKPVVEQGISALGAEWHESCFVCVECGSGFDDGRFFTRENEQKPVCVECEERRLKA